MTDVRRRFFVENWQRINTCLDLLDEKQVWYKHNAQVNSVGNLILHLRGNITQYICAGILRERDIRKRDEEFSAVAFSYSKDQLRTMFSETMNLIKEKFDLLTPEILIRDYEVQGFQENGISILVHVTEHFSYHVGQITYITKFLTNSNTGYYGDLDLNAKST